MSHIEAQVLTIELSVSFAQVYQMYSSTEVNHARINRLQTKDLSVLESKKQKKSFFPAGFARERNLFLVSCSLTKGSMSSCKCQLTALWLLKKEAIKFKFWTLQLLLYLSYNLY